MTLNSFPFLTSKLLPVAGLCLGVVACAPQGGTIQASAPPASQMSLAPAHATAPAAGGMAGMSQGSMNQGGMSHSGMNHGAMNHGSMDHGSMNHGNMNMQQMREHCAQMRADARRGQTISPDMQQMMAHCDQMGGSARGGRNR